MTSRFLARVRADAPVPALAALAVLLLAGSCASTPPSGPFELWAVGPEGQPLAIEEPIAIVRPGVRVDVRPLTAAERVAWLRRHAGLDQDPLASVEDPPLLTLQTRITATGDLPVHVESQSLRLIADGKGSGTAPLDYTRAFELLRPDRAEAPEKAEIDRFMRGLLDGAIDIAPGRAREGLLVFPDPDVESRRLVLVLPFIQAGSETHRTSLAFQRVYLAELASGPAGR